MNGLAADIARPTKLNAFPTSLAIPSQGEIFAVAVLDAISEQPDMQRTRGIGRARAITDIERSAR